MSAHVNGGELLLAPERREAAGAKIKGASKRKPISVTPPDPRGGIEAARAWLRHQIKMAGSQMATDVFDVTPTLADALLERNISNRTLKEGHVVDNMAKLREGRWLLVSQGISLSPEGVLNNGQHRCHAISRTGIAAPMNITFGEPREAFAVLDTQSRRGAAATLEVLGETHGTLLGAALRALKNVQRGGRGNYQIDNEELAPFLAEHPNLRRSCAPGARAANRMKCSSAGTTLAHYLVASQSGRAGMLPKFWESFVTGAGLEHPRDPILILRDSVQKRQIYTKRIPQAQVVAACVINAWNLWVRDKRTVTVKWTDGTPFPEVL